MSRPWTRLCSAEPIDIVAPDGSVRCRVRGHFAGELLIVDDMAADARAGDRVRRSLPNGRTEAFLVRKSQFFNAGALAPHYQMTVEPIDSQPAPAPTSYSINVHGSNARVNVGSTDHSFNVAFGGTLFDDLRRALAEQIDDETQRRELAELVGRLESAPDRATFMESYQLLVSAAADHMTVLAPFLPALAELLNRYSGA